MNESEEKITVFICDLVPCNEMDHACGGGYFSCPHCGDCRYVSETEPYQTDKCSKCGGLFIFV